MKKRLGFALLLVVVAVILPNRMPSAAQSASGQVGAAPARAASSAGTPTASESVPSDPIRLDQGTVSNPLKIAQLKWYIAKSQTQFPVGNQPYGMCFDGENIWVANNSDNTVSKIRASDGSSLGTFSAAGAIGLAFDGANVWVTSVTGNVVYKLRASDGKALGSFPTGKGPFWPAFDGQNVWIPNGDGTVDKLRASDGKNLGIFTAGDNPIAIAFDGQNVWITNYLGGSVTELRASDGALIRTVTTGTGFEPFGVAFDGVNIWVANRAGGTLTKIRASDGAILGNFSAPDGAYGVAFDGNYVWVSGDTFVEAVRARDGAVIARWQEPSTTGIAFDGAHIWISNLNQNTVTKY